MLLLDLVQALNELRLLLPFTGCCYLAIELFELPVVVDDLGRIAKIVAVQKKQLNHCRREENAMFFQ